MVKRLIFTNNHSFIRGYLSSMDIEGAHFFILKEDRISLGIKRYLSESLHMGEITKNEMRLKYGERFKKEFSHVIYRLNKENRSIHWWAMNFTNKFPLLSKLYENAFYFISIREAAFETEDSVFVVVSDNKTIASQLRSWAGANAVFFKAKISKWPGIKDALRRYTPFMILYMFFKIIGRKLISNILLPRPSDKDREKWVIATQFEERAIDKDGFYHDIYFRDIKNLLTDFPSMRNASFITIGFSPYSFMNFMTRLPARSENKDIYPLEYFLNPKDLLSPLMISLKEALLPIRFKGAFDLFGADASILLASEMRESASSGQILLNLSAYAAFRSFSKRYRVKALYYPFENRSWEKMLILALRGNLPSAKIIGYQHTIITPKTLSFYIEKDEYRDMPSPDMIVTDGEITKKIMEEWNFPQDILKTGCALRACSREAVRPVSGRIDIKDILVALGSSVDEYVKMLIFLDEALAGTASYNIKIRPHPAIPFYEALKRFRPRGLKYKISESSLREDLDECDAVIYASSTVSLEAISVGQPVIYVELDDFLNSDPIPDASPLKWRCRKPEELDDLLKMISTIDERDLQDMRRDACEYTSRYFYPVNRENLEVFLTPVLT